jgi:hypothetical protein
MEMVSSVRPSCPPGMYSVSCSCEEGYTSQTSLETEHIHLKHQPQSKCGQEQHKPGTPNPDEGQGGYWDQTAR